ncbi:MAG TPA: tetratricopeptide repeat protein, partial [Pirellulales bacterium]
EEVKFDRFTQPRWDGSPLEGKTIVVHAEQGLGDEVLFASCFNDVIAAARKTIITCEPRLLKLFQRSFPRATTYPWTRRRDWSPLPLIEPVDWQIPAGSLPAYFRATAESFPQRSGFLIADQEQVAAWRNRFAALGHGLKVGLSWRAGGKANEGRKRTISLLDWRQILQTPNVDFVNLQYGDISEDAAEVSRELGVTIHDHEEGDPLVDIDGYAAKIAALDLVISVGNAAVHLAGALDVPAWTMLPRVPSWRWMVTGDVCPWYSSVRLFRQPRRTDWQPVLDQITDRLREIAPRATARSSASSIAASIGAVMPLNVAPDAEPIEAPKSQTDRWLDAKDLGTRQPHQVIAMLDEQAEAARAQGNLAEAERLYREILQITPRQMKAHVGLGNVARETGRMDLAIRSLQRALTMFEPHAANHALLVGMLLDVGRNDEGLIHARRAYELEPKLELAKRELNRALKTTGQNALADSPAQPRQSPSPQPSAISETCSRARETAAKGNLDAAIDLLRTAIAKYSAEPQLHVALAEFLMEDQRFDDAAQSLATATRLDPANANAHIRLSLLHEQLGEIDSAIVAARTAVQHAPAHAPATVHLGKLLRQAGAAAEAEMHYRQIVEQLGPSAELCNLLGVALADQQRDAEAIAQFNRAMQINPAYPPAHWNCALAQLRQENFSAGWDEYDWRWRSGQQDRFAKKFSQPIWAGQPLAGKSIIVYGEQGLGDEIIFATCMPDVIRQAKTCILVCDARLERLFRRTFPEAIVLGVARGNEYLWNLPGSLPVDYQSAAGALPRYLRRSADEFPQQSRLLIPDIGVTARFMQQFATQNSGKKIGISWRTSESGPEASRNSIPLSYWKPLFKLPDISWFNLQGGDCRAEVAKAEANFRNAASSENQFDLDSVAGKIAALDLVISVDNTTAHLAAAIGTPTWIALREPANWRWFANRDDSLWYGSVRLFRQERPQQWDKLFQQLRSELLKPTFRLDEKSNRAAPRAPHWSAANAAIM